MRNPNTRRAYGRAIGDFLTWCGQNGVTSIEQVQPIHAGAWVELLTRESSAPTAKQRLAALRALFDWLVAGQVVPMNPPPACAGRSTW